jgi:DHA1 family inner membrane transport protein
LAVVLAVFGFLVTTPVGAFVGVFGLGAAGSVLMPALQTRLMDVARDGQSLAAALNHAVLNIGNAFGAWLGGLVLALGMSYAWPSRVAVALPLLGLAVLAVGRRVERRSAA